MTEIWILEDHKKILNHMTGLLRDEGFTVQSFTTAEEVLRTFNHQNRPDLLLLDIRLPRKSGLELVKELDLNLPPTIIISGEASVSEALEAMQLGVIDFLEKPFSDERLLCTIRNTLEKLDLQRRVEQLQGLVSHHLVGDSAALNHVRTLIDKVAPTQARVLITGESGTGKELVAAQIHDKSSRARAPFIRLNCAAIPANLIEDELFGHVRGAFTDAKNNKKGLFEEAHGGTLFLDEIGDMDIGLQAKCLRVLEDGKVRPIGGREERQVDVRVIAATNKNLQDSVREGDFREDLFYRLNTITIDIPPLRQRLEDVPLLMSFFLDRAAKLHHMRPKSIDPAAMTQLISYSWPGNVRELRNVCERLMIFGHDPIQVDDLQLERSPGAVASPGSFPAMAWRDFKHVSEKQYLEHILADMDWNYVQVAEILEINRSYLHQKVTALGIDRPKKLHVS